MTDQYSPTRFKILPTVVKNLLIINILMFVATVTLAKFKIGGNTIDLTKYLGLHFFMAEDFKVWQIFTYMFMHDTQTFSHLFFNMFAMGPASSASSSWSTLTGTGGGHSYRHSAHS